MPRAVTHSGGSVEMDKALERKDAARVAAVAVVVVKAGALAEAAPNSRNTLSVDVRIMTCRWINY